MRGCPSFPRTALRTALTPGLPVPYHFSQWSSSQLSSSVLDSMLGGSCIEEDPSPGGTLPP